MSGHLNLREGLSAYCHRCTSWGNTLKIRHICPDIRIQSINNHLAICWAGNLHSAVDETRGRFCSFPRLILPDVLGLWKKVRKLASVELCLSDHAALEEILTGAIEGPVEEREECNGIFTQDLLVEIRDRPRDVHTLKN
jgi:hypothetical protein